MALHKLYRKIKKKILWGIILLSSAYLILRQGDVTIRQVFALQRNVTWKCIDKTIICMVLVWCRYICKFSIILEQKFSLGSSKKQSEFHHIPIYFCLHSSSFLQNTYHSILFGTWWNVPENAVGARWVYTRSGCTGMFC